MKTKKQKQRMLNYISVAYLIIMVFMLIFPPITKLFDRNDIWVGILPLSQFYILFFTGMIVLGLAITYIIDLKIEGGGGSE